MKLCRFSLSLPIIFAAATATAGGIDMNDPRRALGREGDVRIDAQLVRDTVSPGVSIGITYQIHNLSSASVAVASKVTDASYDEESRTITLGVGSEVPPDGNMPQMVVVGPGEKKVLHAAATPALRASAVRTAFASIPRYVQVRVAILRDLRPFATLIEKQDGRTKRRLPDQLFDQWFESNDTIFLNPVPVRYAPADAPETAERRAAGAF